MTANIIPLEISEKVYSRGMHVACLGHKPGDLSYFRAKYPYMDTGNALPGKEKRPGLWLAGFYGR
jgi:hypothetical protein